METTVEKTEKTNSSDTQKILNINIKRIIIGLTEIGNLDIEDFNTNLNISKTIANLNLAEKAYIKTTQTIMKKHIKQNDTGGLVIDANKFYVFKTEQDRIDYENAIEKLNETEVTEKIFPLKVSVLKNVKGLKGNMMAKCHEVIMDDNS